MFFLFDFAKQPKIVGGERAQQNRYPYMAVLFKNDQKLNTATPTIKGGATISMIFRK